ncbi:MAG: LamG domain-containing protein [Acidimicrobiia bacterium]
MRRRAGSLLLAAAVLAGCSGDGTGPTGAADAAVTTVTAATTDAVTPSTAVRPSTAVTPSTDAAMTYRGVVLASGPVAYWPLDDTTPTTAAEVGPGGFTATYAGTVVVGEPPAVDGGGTAVAFDGSGGHLYVGDASGPAARALALSPSLTVELWFRPAAVPPGTVGQLARWRWYGWGLQVVDGRLSGSLWLPGPTPVALAGPALAEGVWHHVVLTKDDSTARLYVDGVPAAEVPATGPVHYVALDPAQDCCGSGGGVAFGRDGDVSTDAAHFLTGGLDEVAVYDRALSADEVAAHAAFRRR